jgi:5-methylcytosine-specific restriction endonuclease McrA
MISPDWRNAKLSGIKRVALWLHSEVKPGGVFTKQQMRAALSTPEKEEQDEQLDRRMRDLRDEGWIIATYREDRSLNSRELSLRVEGGAVWMDGYQSRRPKAVTAKERQAAFAQDDYRCRYCGISAGDSYPEDVLRKAKLTISSGELGLITCCDRCRAGKVEPESAERVLGAARKLGAADRVRLTQWIARGRRSNDPVMDVWTRYNQLPLSQRRVVDAWLKGP